MRALHFALTILSLGFATLSLADGPPPKLELTLKPHLKDGAMDYIDSRLKIEKPNVTANGKLLRMPLLIVSIPTARYDGDGVQARDSAGTLTLAQKDEEPTPTGTYRQWLASRATKGDVVVTFKAPPRVVSATTRTGPLFDLRAENGGLHGAGITFLPLPDGEQPYRLNVKWDLSGMQKGTRGVTSFGEGEINAVGPASRLAFCFYAAGPLLSEPPSASGSFGMYWLTPPPFDTVALATHIRKLHGFMANFFHDDEGAYRVFIRHNPHRSGGGTALPSSFMFGWNESTAPTLDNIQDLLSHEMTHNWPAMEGEHGDTAWYSEGAAEYYSIVLSLRADAIDFDRMMKAINSRAEGYYTNPYRAATNKEAADQFWKDWSAQRVPYGRGFMYLAQVDAKVRAASKGKRSLDDLVVELYRREKHQERYGIAEWLDLVKKEIGPEAQTDYDAMVKGRLLVPPANSFGPCLHAVGGSIQPYALGFDEGSLNVDKKIIRGLVAGSAAAQAGLRDGDIALTYDDPLEVQKSRDNRMKLKVRRGDKEIDIDYLPRGSPVESWHWERVAGSEQQKCAY